MYAADLSGELGDELVGQGIALVGAVEVDDFHYTIC